MDRVLGRVAPLCYALLRIVAGFLFACHGAQKLFGVLGGTVVPIASQRGAAGIIELVGGTLIALGLFTGYAAFVASGEMAVAYFKAHAPQGVWPDYEPRRAGGPVQLSVPVHGCTGNGRVRGRHTAR